jgi:glycosyltransferase involved in cell wall biosynthesis
MHILFVWSYWAYPEVALEFLEKIQKRGHRVSVLLANYPEKVDTVRSKDGIDLYFASKWDALSKIIGTPYPVFIDVSHHMKMIDPDVIHVNSHLFLTSCQALRAARSLRIPSVVTVHGFMAERGMFLNALQRIYMRVVARSVFGNSSTIICLTRKDAENVAKIVGSSVKISIVPNGVDIQLFKPSSKKDPNLIAWVGRLVPEKGLVHLLKAMQEIIKHRPKTKLVLAGDGYLRVELMSLTSKLGLNKNVTFLGSVSRIEVARLLSKSSLFVFPSLMEGMPLALLEAMSSGNAVVVSSIRGIDEIIKDHYDGVLVPPRNAEELASSILALLHDDRLRRRLAEHARETVEKNHSESSVFTRLNSIYESIRV